MGVTRKQTLRSLSLSYQKKDGSGHTRHIYPAHVFREAGGRELGDDQAVIPIQQVTRSQFTPHTFPSEFIELCHTKTGLKIFVVVIPKEGLSYTSPALSSCLWYVFVNVRWYCGVPDTSHVCDMCFNFGVMPANHSFGMTTTKILRPVLAWCGSVNLLWNTNWCASRENRP